MIICLRMILRLLLKSFNLISNFFFFNDTATTEIYTLSLHDALPILHRAGPLFVDANGVRLRRRRLQRSEEHTSELQSRFDLVCRLLLEKKNYHGANIETSIP